MDDVIFTGKFALEQRVRHRLNEYEGYVIGVLFQGDCVQYEVLQITDTMANWRESVLIQERFLEACDDEDEW